MSAPYYSFDPCVLTGRPCGACMPWTTWDRWSCNDRSPCSQMPGGGCSSCPAPVRPLPEPCPAPPIIPPCQPCPPCDRPIIPPTPPKCLSETLAIPCWRPHRCKPCPQYICPATICPPRPCVYPGQYTCKAGCGPCMPIL